MPVNNITSTRRFGISATVLRWLAIFFMLVDHTWIALLKDHVFWPALIGRLAFPIFAFQIAEGCVHTKNFRRYALRLLIFGVVSEIPFNLLTMANFVNPTHQNVMFTLLAGLLVLRLCLWATKRHFGYRFLAIGVFLTVYIAADLLYLDYGGLGVTTVLLFGLTAGHGWWNKLTQFTGLLAINLLLNGRHFPGTEISIQILAVFSIVFIWLYNGQKGKGGKLLQLCAYGFYPIHLFVLALLRRLL